MHEVTLSRATAGLSPRMTLHEVSAAGQDSCMSSCQAQSEVCRNAAGTYIAMDARNVPGQGCNSGLYSSHWHAEVKQEVGWYGRKRNLGFGVLLSSLAEVEMNISTLTPTSSTPLTMTSFSNLCGRRHATRGCET